MTSKPASNPAPNLDFEGLVNLRDVGPLALGNGRRLRRGVLYRSETPQLMSDADVRRAVDDLDVRRVVDLRGQRGGGSGALGEHGRGVVLDFFELAGGMPNGDRAGSSGDASPDGFLPAQLDRAAVVVERFFEVVADNDGATLVHCHTGKDRTGFIVALTLATLGASDEAIIADYEQSTPIFETMMANLRAAGRGVPADAPAYAQEPPSAPGIRELVRRLRGEWPTPEAYLVDHGVDQILIAAVRSRLLE